MNPLDPNEEIEYNVDALKEGSQVLLLRHAKSVFNEAHSSLKAMSN